MREFWIPKSMAQAAAREPANHGANPPDFAAPQVSACKGRAILRKNRKIIIYLKNIGFPLQVDMSASAKVGKIGLHRDAVLAPK